MKPISPREQARDRELHQPGRDRMPVDESDNDAPGISPQKPSSMPRAEDDAETFARSPEYHDRQQSDTADDHSDRPMNPRKDDTERSGGGDQDIDTAGMVPGNKATRNPDATGF